jgi:hypothetical protein
MYCKLICVNDEIHIRIYDDQDSHITAVAYLVETKFVFVFIVNSIKTEQSLLYLINNGLAINNDTPNQRDILSWRKAHNGHLYCKVSLTAKALLNVL